MITKIKNGIIIPGNIKKNIYIKDDIIFDITNEENSFDIEIDAGGKYVSAGFIDIHTHGAGGFDFLDNTEEAFTQTAKFHAKYGATTIVPTITSSTNEQMLKAIAVFERLPDYSGANMPGIHLEGPYFSPAQKGAQDERFIRKFNKEEYLEILNSTDKIIRWTAAPEIEGADEFSKELTQRNVLPCIGHSDANSIEVESAFKNGFTHVTHLYSCTSGVHRKNAFRYAGIIESAYLNDDMTVEIIADGVHLPPDLLKLVYKIKGSQNIALITDSMRAMGMPDGESVLGGKEDGLKVIVEDGVAKLPDRSAFAGSVASCDRLVRNMINLAGVSLDDAVIMATKTPAKIAGLKNKGEIKVGYDADIIIFDENINIEKVIINGIKFLG